MQIPWFRFVAIRNWNDDTFLIDATVNTYNLRKELAVFRMKINLPDAVEKSYTRYIENSNIHYNVMEVDWTPCDTKFYSSVEEAEADFDRIVNNWELYVKGELLM